MTNRGAPATSLLPVQRYIRLCGRLFLSTARPDELIEAARALSPDEWHELFANATAQGMASLVYQMSARSGALASAPEMYAALLMSSYTRSLISVRRIELQLDEMLRAFAAESLETLVLKGPPLARRLYGDPALRPIGDLDLLTRPVDLENAIDTLKSLGYQAIPSYGSPREFHALQG